MSKDDNKFLWCITQILPDGVNYYAGVSKIKLPNGAFAIGNEWSLKKEDAIKYVAKDTAKHDLEQLVLPDNPLAKIEPLEKKQY